MLRASISNALINLATLPPSFSATRLYVALITSGASTCTNVVSIATSYASTTALYATVLNTKFLFKPLARTSSANT